MTAAGLRRDTALPVLAQRRRFAAALPFAIFAVCAAVYVATLGRRAAGTSDNAHFVHLANSFLHGQLSQVEGRPPGDNDWSHYDGRWFVSFPPFPALLIAPLVAVWGTAVWDRLFWAVLAGAAPALLYVLLRALRESGRSERSPGEDLALTALFAFGSVYYYTAVQGTVWFAAHVVASALIALYVFASLDARRPLLAGGALGLAFMTRGPTPLLLGILFVLCALAASRRPDTAAPARLRELFAGLDVGAALRRLALFALPLVVIFAIAMWFNAARFDDPFEFGHNYLKIRWRARIEKWGLFNYHYLARNLAVMLTSLPWLTEKPPYVMISRHGLALWVTTPALLLVLWPKRTSLLMTALALAAGAVALADLCYQNSGWIQFGYRFSLDYAPLLFALLALGGRRFGKVFYALLVLAVAINLFGAITFDRVHSFYDTDASQRHIFQPD
jgi:hypothetical protein